MRFGIFRTFKKFIFIILPIGLFAQDKITMDDLIQIIATDEKLNKYNYEDEKNEVGRYTFHFSPHRKDYYVIMDTKTGVALSGYTKGKKEISINNKYSYKSYYDTKEIIDKQDDEIINKLLKDMNEELDKANKEWYYSA